jgi:hypothetical protein
LHASIMAGVESGWVAREQVVAVGRYVVRVADRELPLLYSEYRDRAVLVHEVVDSGEGVLSFVSVETHARGSWPYIVVSFPHHPSAVGFPLGIALIPEMARLFVGAGTRLLALDVTPDAPRLLWEDDADTGFWGWQVFGETVVMSAELELAAWDVSGAKLWSTFVEPPWGYRVEDDAVTLDVMGVETTFALRDGPVRR